MLYYGLTPLGIFHTLVSFVALICGAMSLIRYGSITRTTGVGKWYVYATVIVCLTGFGIFQHGGFGKPHALGVITLLTLAGIFATEGGMIFKTWSQYVVTIGYSLTYFFHIIPTITEGATRLPYGSPLAASPEDPGIQTAIGACFIIFLAGAAMQVRSIKRQI